MCAGVSSAARRKLVGMLCNISRHWALSQRQSQLILSQSVKHVRSTCPILRFQTYAESVLVALLFCVSFGDRNTRIPFVCNALKIWEVRNFPLDFLGQVRNIPRAEFSPAEKTPYRIPPPPPGRPKMGCETFLATPSWAILTVPLQSKWFSSQIYSCIAGALPRPVYETLRSGAVPDCAVHCSAMLCAALPCPTLLSRVVLLLYHPRPPAPPQLL